LKRLIATLGLLFGVVGFSLAVSKPAQAGTLTFDFLEDPAVTANPSGHLATINNPAPPGVLTAAGVGHSFGAVSDATKTIFATAETYNNLNFSGAAGLPNLTVAGSPSLSHTLGTNLTVKYNNPAGENGLGMLPDPNGNNEIGRKASVAIDFRPLETALGGVAKVTGIQFIIGSAQANEGYALYGSNVPFLDSTAKLIQNDPGGDGSPVSAILHPAPVSLADIAAYRFFIVTSYGSGNSYKPNILLNDVIVSSTDIVPHGVPTPEPASMLIWSAVAVVAAMGNGIRRRRGRTGIQA
jgi:hypothetical protein